VDVNERYVLEKISEKIKGFHPEKDLENWLKCSFKLEVENQSKEGLKSYLIEMLQTFKTKQIPTYCMNYVEDQNSNRECAVVFVWLSMHDQKIWKLNFSTWQLDHVIPKAAAQQWIREDLKRFISRIKKPKKGSEPNNAEYSNVLEKNFNLTVLAHLFFGRENVRLICQKCNMHRSRLLTEDMKVILKKTKYPEDYFELSSDDQERMRQKHTDEALRVLEEFNKNVLPEHIKKQMRRESFDSLDVLSTKTSQRKEKIIKKNSKSNLN